MEWHESRRRDRSQRCHLSLELGGPNIHVQACPRPPVSAAVHIAGTQLRKIFNRRLIFSDIEFSVSQGETLLITGRSGSGKLTSSKLLVDSCPDGRDRAHSSERGNPGRGSARRRRVGGPVPADVRGVFGNRKSQVCGHTPWLVVRPTPGRGSSGACRLGCQAQDAVRSYSSGMKQRVKYSFALLHAPPILVLDEPMANLDADGIAMVRDVMEEQRKDRILVVATNDLSDCPRADAKVNLDDRT